MMVITCTSLVFCALGVHVPNLKKRKHAVCERDFLTKRVFNTFQHVQHDKTSRAQQITLDQYAFAIDSVISVPCVVVSF